MSRLTAERQQELFTSVLSLIAKHGYEKVTMDQIATETHSSKATLYRGWGSKAALVTDALSQIAPDVPDEIDTGSLRGDLRAWGADTCSTPDSETELLIAVLHACKTDKELADSLRERLVAGHRAAFDAIIDRAIERGEIRADSPGLTYVPVMLAGALMMRELIEGLEPDTDYIHDFIDVVVLPALLHA